MLEDIIRLALEELNEEENEQVAEETQSNKYIVTVGGVAIDTVIATDDDLKEVLKRLIKANAKDYTVFQAIGGFDCN